MPATAEAATPQLQAAKQDLMLLGQKVSLIDGAKVSTLQKMELSSLVKYNSNVYRLAGTKGSWCYFR